MINDGLQKIDLDHWHYQEHFLPPDQCDQHPVVDQIEAYIADKDLASHPFFTLAATDPQALELWLSQELVMTNAFSQIILAVASKVENVHIRAVLTQIAYGEHGNTREGVARRAHPWLLHKLANSVGLTPDSVKPREATINLISRLAAASATEAILPAIAWIGVGNERLIIPEYSAIEKCFSKILPRATYEPFLQANLKEDVLHSRLCYQVACSLISCEADAALFYREAISSVDARWAYFDALAREVHTP